MGLEKAGRVVKSLSPGVTGTKQWQKRYGDRLVKGCGIGGIGSGGRVQLRLRSLWTRRTGTRKATKRTGWLCSRMDIPFFKTMSYKSRRRGARLPCTYEGRDYGQEECWYPNV